MIRKAVEVEPENSAYLDSLGWLLFRQGKYRRSRRRIAKGLRKNARRHDPRPSRRRLSRSSAKPKSTGMLATRGGIVPQDKEEEKAKAVEKKM